MIISFDTDKRKTTLDDPNRRLDFCDFPELFKGINVTWEDIRKDYGEKRYVVMGFIGRQLVYAVWTPRDKHTHHVISMRKASKRETKNFTQAVDRRRRRGTRNDRRGF